MAENKDPRSPGLQAVVQALMDRQKPMREGNEPLLKSDRLLSFVFREWRLIKMAPFHFFGLLAVFVGTATIGLWYVYDWRYSSVLESKNAQLALQSERIEQKNDLIADVQRQLSGVPANQITGEIARLKEQLANLQTRTATVINSRTTQNSDKTYTIVKTVRVRAYSTPNHIIIYAKSPGITSIMPGGQTMIHGQARISPDVMATRIKNPSGDYTITIISTSAEAELTFEFG